jgi:hypothetical protein
LEEKMIDQELKDVLSRAKKALKDYGTHLPRCTWFDFDMHECECGFWQACSGIEPKPKEKEK